MHVDLRENRFAAGGNQATEATTHRNIASANENDRLKDIATQQKVTTVDFLQVSGQTVIPFIEHLANKQANCSVRVLLVTEQIAEQIDGDGVVDHVSRIRTTVQKLKLLASEHPNFHVQIKYYDTWPALCAVLLGPGVASVCWSPTFRDPTTPDVVRVRGHLAATVIATAKAGELLLTFARHHFDAVWAAACDSNESREHPARE